MRATDARGRVVVCLAGLICWALAVSQAAAATRLYAAWSARPLKLSGQFDKKWADNYNALRLRHGWLYVQNDQENLYFLVDLTGDTEADERRNQPPWGDGLSISFDTDGNGQITPQTDVHFALLRGKYQLGRKLFTGPGRFSEFHSSQARVKTTFSNSPGLKRRHRIWELAIPLREISATAGQRIAFGIQTKSVSPAFNDMLPRDHWRSFRQLVEVQLSAAPMLAAFARIDPQSLRRFILKQPRQVVVRPVFEPVGGGSLAPPRQPCAPPEGKPVRRTILPDGTIELHYADGSKKQHKNGHWKFFCPDGTPVPTQVLKSQIMPTFPPTLPDQETLAWLEVHNERLLGIISTIVDDEQMIADYLNAETVAGNITVYQQIHTRSNTIDNLLVE